MQIKILDQVHLSSVRASTLAAGEVVEVSRDLGAELLAKHPDKFEAVADAAGADQVDGVAADHAAGGAGQAGEGAKSETPPQNKAELAPANKAARPPRGKRGRSKS